MNRERSLNVRGTQSPTNRARFMVTSIKPAFKFNIRNCVYDIDQTSIIQTKEYYYCAGNIIYYQHWHFNEKIVFH